MRLVHTADWHLGQSLGPFSRDAEHARFLAWLLDVLAEERADALLVCGDVFDTGNPNPVALRRWYDFLASCRRRLPALQVVVIGGNHDAPHRLDAPGPILEPFGVRVVGALPRTDGALDVARCLVPLRGRSGDVEAVCAAVPFLRMADLGPVDAHDADAAPTGDPVVDGVRAVYARVLDAAFAATREGGAHAGAAVVGLGHALFAGGALTDESERPVFGNAHALPVEMFPPEVAYVALGHLHRAQALDDHDASLSSHGALSNHGARIPRIRYSGSPLPLSMTERDYRHQVLVVDLAGPRLAAVRAREVPRSVSLLRVPADEGFAPLERALEALRALDAPAPRADDATGARAGGAAAGDGARDDLRPLLEVRVRLSAPTPDVRARVEEALEGKGVRLLRVRVEHAGDGGALADRTTPAPLGDIEPMRVLEGLYRRTFGGDVPANIAAAFASLVDEVRAEKVADANDVAAHQLTLHPAFAHASEAREASLEDAS